MPHREHREGSRFPWAALEPRSTGVARYVVAAILIGAALLLRLALGRWLGPNVPYLQFFPAVLLASWYGGLGPGLFATALSAGAAMFFFFSSPGSGVARPADLVSLTLFVLTGAGIAWLNHRLRAAEHAQREAAASAKARAERLDAILNTTVDGVIVIDATGRIEAFNRGAERLFGYPESEVLGRNVSALMPSPDHEAHDRYLERYLTTGEARIIGVGRQVIGRRRDGSVFPVHLSVGDMRIDGQRKFTGLLHDLTKRTQLETELGASEARWRSVIDSAVDGIIVIDGRGRIEKFNPAAERLFGYSEAEVLGQNVNVLMPQPYHEDHDTYLARYLATGKAKIIGSGREVQGLRKDGTTFPLHLSVGEVLVQGERRFTGIVHDLSARVQIETQLREQAALAKLGEMAAVIAHEIKNPLAGIRGAIQVFGSRMSKDGVDAPILKEILARIDSLDQMMKDLLLFARPPAPQRTPTDIVQLVAATARLFSQDPSVREVDVAIEGSAPPVHADPKMLQIVFQNLLLNAAHAMDGRGRIRVTVEASQADCHITFTDAGPGIPLEARDRIFAPFFTTKARGSGLGLPTAKRLIDAHNGHISIDCPPGAGTNVVIRLPIATE